MLRSVSSYIVVHLSSSRETIGCTTLGVMAFLGNGQFSTSPLSRSSTESCLTKHAIHHFSAFQTRTLSECLQRATNGYILLFNR